MDVVTDFLNRGIRAEVCMKVAEDINVGNRTDMV